MEVMVPTVLELCLPWLITLTILTRQTFIKLRSLQRAHGTAVQRAGTSSASPVPSGRAAGMPLLHGMGLGGQGDSTTAVPAHQWDTGSGGTEEIAWTSLLPARKIVLLFAKCSVL